MPIIGFFMVVYYPTLVLNHYMPKTCKISIKNHEIFIKLKNTETARSIWQNLPINSKINTWGDEIYFLLDNKM